MMATAAAANISLRGAASAEPESFCMMPSILRFKSSPVTPATQASGDSSTTGRS
jgi:hypothetical protein